MTSENSSDRRLTENEVLFREVNERVHRGFHEVNRLAAEDNQYEFVVGDDTEFSFYCECSDSECQERIRTTVGEYEQIHRKRDYFIVLPGHVMAKIERVISKRSDFYIVQKRTNVAKAADVLRDPPELR